MAWFKKQKTTVEEPPRKPKTAEGMWLKCNHCREIIYRKEVERNHRVCPKCDYHFPISVLERIALLLDVGTVLRGRAAADRDEEEEDEEEAGASGRHAGGV